MSEETVEWLGNSMPKYATLDFETFKSRNNSLGIPTFNNFFLFFLDEVYQSSPLYKKLGWENPETVERVRETLLRLDYKRSETSWVDEVAPVLYEAYKIVKGYVIDGKPVANYPDLFA